MASIEWEDELGFASLDNGVPDPGGRFMGWEILTDPIGPMRPRLASGIPDMWRHRHDYGAKFSLREIPDTAAMQALLGRLKRHLHSAGSVTVNTGDIESRVWTCYIYPGTSVTLGYDPKYRKRSVTLSLLNSEAVDLSCEYP